MHDNTAQNRYELEIDGQIVFAKYRKEQNKISITHVETPPALRGQGAAGKLMQAIMENAKAQNLKILPICPYAVTWLNKHKEYADWVVG